MQQVEANSAVVFNFGYEKCCRGCLLYSMHSVKQMHFF